MEIFAFKQWVDQHAGMVELEGDVLHVVERIKEIGQGRIRVYWDEQKEEFYLVETCLDHTERLIFTAAALDQRVIDRLLRADHWGADTPDHRDSFRPDDQDFVAELDKSNEALMDRLEDGLKDELRDAGERLAWALEQDRKGVGASISVSKDTS